MPKTDTYPWKPGSQNDRLFRHLVKGKTLTRLEAMVMFHVQNPTARISELRAELGDAIKMKEKIDPNGQTYAEYRLVVG